MDSGIISETWENGEHGDIIIILFLMLQYRDADEKAAA